MRIALYHNLPPGGALRVVRESVAELSRLPDVEVEVFVPDVGEDAVYDTSTVLEVPGAASVHVEPVPRRFGRVNSVLRRPLAVSAVRVAERHFATRIDRAGFDVCIVH